MPLRPYLLKQSIWLAALFFCLQIAPAIFCCSAQAAAPRWSDAPFSYYANNVSVEHVLHDFARNFSLRLDISERPKGRVNGRFNSANPTDFMDRMGSVYGFSWFSYAGVLYISTSGDSVTHVVDARGGSIGRLREALYELGVLDSRFGWGEMPERGIALVSGPRKYVELVEQIVSQLPTAAGAQEVRVFRLKHASVLDRTIHYRDREIMTPGIATILQQLISGNGETGNGSNEVLSSISAPLRSRPPAIMPAGEGVRPDGMPPLPAIMPLGMHFEPKVAPAVEASGVSAASTASQAQRTVQPSIQPDPRLNAIIVSDVPDRMPIYQKLIEELDVPTALVQIEAQIIDVSRSRLQDLGIDWGARFAGVGIGFGNTVGITGVSATGAVPSGTTTIMGDAGNVFSAKIRLLENQGDARVLASPSILTVDNLGAVLDLSDTFYVQTRGQQVATVTPVSVGTTLNVTPRYVPGTPQGSIELTVDIEDGKILPTQLNGLPVVRKSSIGTQARIGENEALVIAGYNSSDDQLSLAKTPWLGDIPLIGALFRNRHTTERKTERLFIIRPTMIEIPDMRYAP